MADDPRDFIEQLRNYLDAQAPQFPEAVYARGAAALSRYLDGQAPTLDAAFGLVAPAHRAPELERRFQLAVRVDLLRREGKTWEQITESIPLGVRTLQRLQSEFKYALSLPALMARLDAALSAAVTTDPLKWTGRRKRKAPPRR